MTQTTPADLTTDLSILFNMIYPLRVEVDAENQDNVTTFLDLISKMHHRSITPGVSGRLVNNTWSYFSDMCVDFIEEFGFTPGTMNYDVLAEAYTFCHWKQQLNY